MADETDFSIVLALFYIPFLCSGIISNREHSLGHFLFSHIFWQIVVSIVVIASPPYLNSSAGMLSTASLTSLCIAGKFLNSLSCLFCIMLVSYCCTSTFVFLVRRLPLLSSITDASDHKEDEGDSFYEDIEPKKDILIVMGDYNAKVGPYTVRKFGW